MKRMYIHRIWTLLAACTLTLASCGTDDSEEAPEPIEAPVISSINVEGGQSGEFTFTAPAAWTLRVTKGSTWCKIESQYMSGEEGEQTIPYTIEEANAFDVEDTAEVTITFGSGSNTATTTFEVIRAARSRVLTLSDEEGTEISALTITTAQLEDEIMSAIFVKGTIKANFDWSIKEQPEWLRNEGGETFSGSADEAVEVTFSTTRNEVPVEASTVNLTIVDVNTPEWTTTLPVKLEGFSSGYFTTEIDRNTINIGRNFTADGLLTGGHLSNDEGLKSYTISLSAADPDNMPHLLVIYRNAKLSATMTGDIVGNLDDQNPYNLEGAWLNISKQETRATLEDNKVTWVISADVNEDVERQAMLYIIPGDVYAQAKNDLQGYFAPGQRTVSGTECTINTEVCSAFENLDITQEGGKAETSQNFTVTMLDYGMGHTCTKNDDGTYTIQMKRSSASYVMCTIVLPESWNYRTFKYYYATNWSSGFTGPFVFTNQPGDRKDYECDWVTATLMGSGTEYQTKISVTKNEGEAREYRLVLKYQDASSYSWVDAGTIIVKQPGI